MPAQNGIKMASRGEIEDLLHCMICFDSYNNPKMLRCGHTFCAECLEGYLNTYQQQRRAHAGKIPCPTCRELTTLPATGVQGLRNDFKVKKIEEMFRTVNLRDRQSGKFCDSCRAQKKNSHARYFCTSCSMNYCKACRDRHDRNPVFKEHRTLDKEAESSSDIFCKMHKTEAVKFFCRGCETVICTLCIMNQHENHDIIQLSDVYQKHQEEIKSMQQTIEARMQRLKDKGAELDKLRILNLKSCQQAEILIKDKTRETIEVLKKQEGELLQELQKKKEEKLARISREIESVGFHMAKACSLQDFATSTTRRNSLKLMAVHEELILRMRTVVDSDTSLPVQNVQSVITFLPGRNDFKMGRIDEVQGTAEELKSHGAVSNPPPPRRSLSNSGMGASFTKPKLLFSVDKLGGGFGEIRDPLGAACMPNGEIVITEWGNKRVQVFDSVGKPVSFLAAGKIGPQGVTITLKGNIMVTDAQNKRLEVFTPSGNSLSKWGFGRFYGPCGVAVCPNGNCVVTDIAEHAVNIYMGEKKCIKRFGSRGSKNEQFDNPLYCTSGHNNDIIISDSDNHCVKVFDNRGRFLRKFGNEGHGDGQMKFPRGVVMDQDGNILVADRNNDRVSLFTLNGGFIGHVLTKEDGIRDPYALAVSSARNLVVTESGVDRAAVKLFQM